MFVHPRQLNKILKCVYFNMCNNTKDLQSTQISENLIVNNVQYKHLVSVLKFSLTAALFDQSFQLEHGCLDLDGAT